MPAVKVCSSIIQSLAGVLANTGWPDNGHKTVVIDDIILLLCHTRIRPLCLHTHNTGTPFNDYFPGEFELVRCNLIPWGPWFSSCTCCEAEPFRIIGTGYLNAGCTGLLQVVCSSCYSISSVKALTSARDNHALVLYVSWSTNWVPREWTLHCRYAGCSVLVFKLFTLLV